MWNVSFCKKTHDYCVILSDGAFFQTVFASNNIQQHLQNCFAFELLVCLGTPCNLPCDSFASAATSRALAGLTTGADMAQSEPRLQGSMNHSEIANFFSTNCLNTYRISPVFEPQLEVEQLLTFWSFKGYCFLFNSALPLIDDSSC